MKEGIINNSIVPLSDIELLLEQEKNIDCCTCDIPDAEPIKPLEQKNVAVYCYCKKP